MQKMAENGRNIVIYQYLSFPIGLHHFFLSRPFWFFFSIFFNFFQFLFFCFIPNKINPNLYGIIDGSKFWWFPWFPENSLMRNITLTVYVHYHLNNSAAPPARRACTSQVRPPIRRRAAAAAAAAAAAVAAAAAAATAFYFAKSR